MALVPYDGLLLLVDTPGLVEAWKEALSVVFLAWAWRARSRQRTELPGWFTPALVLFALAVLSAVASPQLQSLVGLKIGFFYLLILPLGLALAPLSAPDRDRLITVLMANASIVSVIALWQQVVGHAALNDLGFEYNTTIRFTAGWLRSFATFNQPFPFAFFVMTAVLVCVPIALEHRQRLRNRLFLVMLPVLAAGIFFSFVRGAYLGLAVGLLYLGLVRYRVLGHLLLLIPVAGLAVVSIGGTSAVVSTGSLDARIEGWASELATEGIEPLGSGIGTVGSAPEFLESSEKAVPSSPSPEPYQPDNYYIKTLIELGPIGLWLLMLVLVSAVMHIHRTARRATEPMHRGFAHGVAANTVAAMAAGLISSFWEIFPAEMFFWLLLGVISSTDHRSFSTPSSSSRKALEEAYPSTAAT